VKEGRYDNANDDVRTRLRLIEGQAAKLAALRAALVEGEQSGASTPFDFEAFIARKRAARSSAYDRLLRSFALRASMEGIDRGDRGDGQ
jgi:antitoxin ParD1/3/4